MAAHALHNRAWVIISTDGNDFSVDDMEQLEKREDAELRVQVEHCGAGVIVGNQAQHLDALQNRYEFGQAFSIRCDAFDAVQRAFKYDVGMEREGASASFLRTASI
jgi:hypothetical protein